MREFIAILLGSLIGILLAINLVILGEGFSHIKSNKDCSIETTRLGYYIAADKAFRLGCWLGETK